MKNLESALEEYLKGSMDVPFDVVSQQLMHGAHIVCIMCKMMAHYSEPELVLACNSSCDTQLTLLLTIDQLKDLLLSSCDVSYEYGNVLCLLVE